MKLALSKPTMSSPKYPQAAHPPPIAGTVHLVDLAEATDLSLADLDAGTGYMFLFFRWRCLVWHPLVLQYGTRPVYMLSILATAAIQVRAPWATGKGTWIASKILQGFFGAPIESLCEISITDIVGDCVAVRLAWSRGCADHVTSIFNMNVADISRCMLCC